MFNYIRANVEDRETPQPVDDGSADIFQVRFQFEFWFSVRKLWELEGMEAFKQREGNNSPLWQAATETIKKRRLTMKTIAYAATFMLLVTLVAGPVLAQELMI